MSGITLKNGLTADQADLLAGSMALMTGPGADVRLEFIETLRTRWKAKELAKEMEISRKTASAFRAGILGGCSVAGRTDPQIDLLLRVADILCIRSWIELPKVEEYQAAFDVPFDTPFDGDA